MHSFVKIFKEKKNMNLINFIQKFFGKSESGNKAPLVIINKDQEIIEYDSIESALADLEKELEVLLVQVKNGILALQNLSKPSSE